MTTAVPVALLPLWRERATGLEPYAPAAAQAFRAAANELEETLQSTEESVSLKDASTLGGYSVGALQKMVAAGRIQNFGRKGKPRISRVAVPVKPGFLLPASGRSHIERSAVVASVIKRGN